MIKAGLYLSVLLMGFTQVAGANDSCVFATPPEVLFFPSFADGSTQALWLFDDTQYGYNTLTDASYNEFDLRLMAGGDLVPGVYGSALRFKPSDNYAVSYAGFHGSISNHHMREKNGKVSGLWSPTEEPRNLLRTLSCSDWTIEYRFNLTEINSEVGTILDLGDQLLPGLKIELLEEASGFAIHNYYQGFQAEFAHELSAQSWHHVAFVSANNKIKLYIDGVEISGQTESLPRQELPPSSKPKNRQHENREFTKDSTEEWKIARRFNVSIGENRSKQQELTGMMDELRISNKVRYARNFMVPGTFSRNYSPDAYQPKSTSDRPLLFNKEWNGQTLPLGTRKHLFVDDSMIESFGGSTKIKVNELKNPEPVYLKTANGTVPFEPVQGMWRESVFEHNKKILFYIGDGYSHPDGISRLYSSEDGLTFESRNYGKGDGVIITERPMGGAVMQDPNPAASSETKYKMASWVANRGIYLYLSPDGITWRRNEVAMLPLSVGGDAELMYDDQKNVYYNFMKRGAGTPHDDEDKGRAAIYFKTDNPYKPWPFRKLEKPYFESWTLPMLSDEGETGMRPRTKIKTPWFILADEIYRPRPLKYQWAPDTYLAFPWVSTTKVKDFTQFIRSELAVSRDGENWKTYDGDKNKWLFPPVGKIEDAKVTTTLSFYGVVRRDDEIWFYVEYNTDAAPNGKDGFKRYYRVRAPLDRFAALNADKSGGEVLTKPFRLDGKNLELNVEALKGSVRVALTDKEGQVLKGFGFNENDEIKKVDDLRRLLSWRGSNDLGSLSGLDVRLKLSLKNAKVYSMQVK